MALGMLAGLAGGAGGGVIGSATVRLLLDSSQFDKGLTTAQAQTQKSTAAMGKSTSKFGTVAKVALLAAAAAAIKFAMDSVKSAQQAEVAQAKLQNTLDKMPKLAGANIDAFLEQAAALQDLTGASDEAVIGIQAMLGTFQLTEDQIRRLTPLVVDMALKFGKDFQQSSIMVGKAVLGNIGALQRVGISIDETAFKADHFGAVMQALGEQAGGFGEQFGKTFEGRLAILAGNWDDFKEIVGGFLIDAGTPLLGFFNDLVETIGPVASVVGDLTAAILSNKDAVSLVLLAWHPWLALLSEGKAAVDRYNQSGSVLTAVYGELNAATREHLPIWAELVGAETEAGAATQEAGQKAAGAAREQQALAAAHQEAAEAAQEQYVAELSLVGGFLGVQGAALSAKDAQQDYADALAEVNRLTERGKQGTQAWKDAVQNLRQAELGAVEGQLSLAQAVADYIGQIAEGEAAQNQAIGMIRQFGQAAGLSQGQINQLVNRVLALVRAYDQIPENVKTTVTTTYKRVGTPSGAGGHAAQHGFHGYVHSPTTFLAGEAGTERVDISPHVGSPKHAGSMASGGGHGGNVTVRFGNVAIYNDTDLEELAGMVAGVVEQTVWRGANR